MSNRKSPVAVVTAISGAVMLLISAPNSSAASHGPRAGAREASLPLGALQSCQARWDQLTPESSDSETVRFQKYCHQWIRVKLARSYNKLADCGDMAVLSSECASHSASYDALYDKYSSIFDPINIPTADLDHIPTPHVISK